MAKFKPLDITDLLLIEPETFYDERGFFYESYNQKEFDMAVNRKVNFVQDNHSKSSKGVLRGLHFQTSPYEQAKLVRVIQGSIFDVAVDIRKNSPTYGKWEGAILSDENKMQFWIPEGFAHGFLVLSDTADVIYKTNNFYSKKHEKCILWNDEKLGIEWPFSRNIILSSKDKNGVSFDEV